MTVTAPAPEWLDEFVLARDARDLGRGSEIVASVRARELIPISRGVYRQADAATRDPDRRADDAFLARIRATHLVSPTPLVFAGLSAAAGWGLPLVGAWPDRIEVASDPALGGRSNARVHRSFAGHPHPIVERGGLRLTSLARTVVDVGRTASLSQSLAIADAALHGQAASLYRVSRQPVSMAELESELSVFGGGRGVRKCRGMLRLADGDSGSAGESVSRLAMHLLGFPPPLLQVPFSDASGFVGIVDFWWPELQLIGEFDGIGKYLRDEYANGRTPAQIVVAEKTREDRLRALGNGVTRWGWETARSLPALRAHLTAAGLRVV